MDQPFPEGEVMTMEALPPEGTVERLFADLDPTVEAYAGHLQELRTICRDSLDQETLANLLVSFDDRLADPSRKASRGFAPVTKHVRARTEGTIVLARMSAQSYSLRHTTEPDVIEKTESLKQELYKKRDNTDPSGPAAEARYQAGVWLGVFEAERARCEDEKTMFNAVAGFLDADPQNIIGLQEAIVSPDLDHQEYRPLLSFLAKNYFDPLLAPKIIDEKFLDLSAHPEHSQADFCKLFDSCFSDDEAEGQAASEILSPESLDFLGFIRNSLALRFPNSDGSIPSLSEIFTDTPLQEWPDPLRQALEKAWCGYVDTLKQGYVAALKPYADTKNFLVPKQTATAVQNGGRGDPSRSNSKRASSTGSRRKGGGRTTPKTDAAMAFIPETAERPTPISRLIDVTNSPGENHIRTSHQIEEGTDIREVLLNLNPVKDFLRGYAFETRVTDDLLHMIESIIEQPLGNGASKMKANTYRLLENPGDSVNRKLTIWHLSPNERSGLSIGDVARDLRVYYVVLSQTDGSRSLGITRIDHKNSAVKIHGTF